MLLHPSAHPINPGLATKSTIVNQPSNPPSKYFGQEKIILIDSSISSMPPPTTKLPPTCTACLDPLLGPHLLIDTHALCHACFRHLFTLALSNESSYPASWAGRPLSATRYAHLLGPDLLAAYSAKAIEYACPPQERVFCSRADPPRRPEACGRFVGKWAGAGGAVACVKCEDCAWYTCLRCAETFSPGDVAGAEAAIEHECDARRDGELEERAFEGLKKGREWQVCPNEECKRRVELSDGCNHMRCVCRTHFCFICGRPVRDGEGHWKKEGGCPRFGQKDSKRAIYDEEDVWNDNDDIGDEERALEMQRVEDGEEEALRRAFDLQMQMVDDMRRELEDAEMARLRNRARQGEEMVAGPLDGRQNHERKRRRPRKDREIDYERRHERHNARRRAEAQPFPAPRRFVERNERRPKGLRAFVNNAIDTADMLLFGSPPSRRR
jgi:hypothetical protein